MRPHLSLIARAVVAAALATAAGGLVACGGSDDEDPGPAKSAQAPATSTADEAVPGDGSSKRESAAEGQGDDAAGDGAANGGASSGDGSSGAGAAGDGDRDGGGSARGEDGAAGTGGGAASIERVVTGMYADLAAGDAAGVCSALSRSAQAQIAQQVPGGSTVPPEDRTCAQSLDKFLEVASGSGILERLGGTTVSEVDIEGDTATATVVIAGTPGDVALLRERGRWVLGSPPSIGKS
jgi:hypothetical protein